MYRPIIGVCCSNCIHSMCFIVVDRESVKSSRRKANTCSIQQPQFDGTSSHKLPCQFIHCLNSSCICSLSDYMSVFFNLFFEAEPFAAVLIAQGTHGCSQKFVLGKGVLGEEQRPSDSLPTIQGIWGALLRTLLQWSSGRSPDRRCILDALKSKPRKRVQWPQITFSAHFLIRFGGTLGFHWRNPQVPRNPVEKHWIKC